MKHSTPFCISKLLLVQLLFALFINCAAHASDRADDIRKYMEAIDGQDAINSAITADEALKSEDPLLRSLILEKVLSHKNGRVRSIGLAYLVKTQKRLVLEATASEATLASIRRPSDRADLLKQLVIIVEFSNFDPQTARFQAKVSIPSYSYTYNDAQGAIGQDGITMTTNSHKMNLGSSSNGYLLGTVTYRLYETIITLPVKTALP